MKIDKKLLLKTFRNTFGAALYIFVVSQVMVHGDKMFGNNNTFAPFAILLLFSLSAAIVGGLVLGQSVILFLNKKNDDGLKTAIYSIGWMASYTVIALAVLFFLK